MPVRMTLALDEFELSTGCFVNAQPVAIGAFTNTSCERDKFVTTLSLDLFYDLDGLLAMTALGRIMQEHARFPSLYVWENSNRQTIMLIYFGIPNPNPGQVREVCACCHNPERHSYTLRYTELFSAAMTEVPRERVEEFRSQIDMADRYNVRLCEIGSPRSHIVKEYPLTHVILTQPDLPFFKI